MTPGDEKDWDDGDEVLTPEVVTGPDSDGPPLRTRRDRKPLYAIVAGLTACWFTLFGPLLVVFLAPTAIILGRKVLQRIDEVGGTETERKQAKIGYVSGIVALALLVVLLVLGQLFYDPPDKSSGEVNDKSSQAPG